MDYNNKIIGLYIMKEGERQCRVLTDPRTLTPVNVDIIISIYTYVVYYSEFTANSSNNCFEKRCYFSVI